MIVLPIFTEKLHFIMFSATILLTVFTMLVFRKYELLPISKRHFLLIWTLTAFFLFMATYLTNFLLSTGLFRETNNFSLFTYVSYGGLGLYVKSFLFSIIGLFSFYWIRFIKMSENLYWDFLLLGLFYGMLVDLIVDIQGLLLFLRLIETGQISVS